MSESATQINSEVWRRLYAAGGNDMRYPSDVLVRLGAWRLDRARDRRMLDFGFGTGANLVHFAGQGFEMHGVEISEHALARARERVAAAGLSAELRLITPGQKLPYADGYFDVVYAWQMLYYNDHTGWRNAVAELERVTRPEGRVIVATAAPGDVSQLEAEALGEDLYRSRVPGQEGCVVLIPDRERLSELFPGRVLEVGEFGYRFDSALAHYWLVTYRKQARAAA
jgi:SAM-dependent methyltransferase